MNRPPGSRVVRLWIALAFLCSAELLPLGATPTALRGRVFGRQTDSHAHAEPWAWHPETQWRSVPPLDFDVPHVDRFSRLD
jgi:hypothetical protein